MRRDGTQTQAGIYFGDASERPALPEQTNYQEAEEMAKKALLHLDPARQAARTGARLEGNSLHLEWFGRPVAVSLPGGEVRDLREGVKLPVWERIILQHYAGGTVPVMENDDLIGFAEVPSGQFYLDAFVRRAHRPLAEFFGGRPKFLHDAAELLGGRPEDLGDAAASIPVLPRVRVTAVIHEADDEFPADAKLLFPAGVVSFFCTEDIAVIGGFAAGRLIRAGRQLDGLAGRK
jgi:hypothetical protein